MMHYWNQIKRAGAYTLTEIVLVIVILGIIVGASAEMLHQGMNAYFTQRDILRGDWQGRVLMARLSRELRAGLSNGLSVGVAHQLTMNNTEGESLAVQQAGNSVSLDVAGVPRTLADGIDDLTFSYMDSDGASTGSSADTRYITIDAVVDMGFAHGHSIRTTIAPRNIR